MVEGSTAVSSINGVSGTQETNIALGTTAKHVYQSLISGKHVKAVEVMVRHADGPGPERFKTLAKQLYGYWISAHEKSLRSISPVLENIVRSSVAKTNWFKIAVAVHVHFNTEPDAQEEKVVQFTGPAATERV